MPKPPVELENFVPPGRLLDPFNKSGADGQQKKVRVAAKTGRVAPPVLPLRREDNQTSPLSDQPRQRRVWPYYVASNTQALLESEITTGKATEEEVPMIMKLALIVAQVLRRVAPTVTDLQAALEFRNINRIKQVIAGEVIIQKSRMSDRHNSGMMNPKQLKEFWISLAKAVLQILEPPQGLAANSATAGVAGTAVPK